MRTLFVFSNASHYGGAEKSIEAILPELAREYRILVFAENQRHVEALNGLNLGKGRVIALAGGNGPGTWFATVRRVRGYMHRFSPDAIIANTNKAGLLAMFAQRTSKGSVPALVFVRDFLWRYKRIIFSGLRSSVVVAPSEAVASHPAWHRILSGVNVRVISDAVLPAQDTFSPLNEASSMVLCLANIARWKGLHHLIAAFALVAERNDDAKLVIAGSVHEVKYRQALGRQISRLRLGGRVSILPYVDDVDRLYREAALVVSSSISRHGGPETFGRTVIEAWAHARPVVAFATGGPKYLIRHGVDGLLVAEGDSASLGEAMDRLLHDRSLARLMGHAGRVRAEGEFSVESIAGQVLLLLDEMQAAGREEQDVRERAVRVGGVA